MLYPIPPWLKTATFQQRDYKEWLDRKAAAHRKRDNKRWKTKYDIMHYRIAIHRAVVRSDGYDPYTGDRLEWGKVRKYDNKKSNRGGTHYKAKFKNLPTVDHRNPNSKKPDFEIVSWFINAAKNDLTRNEFFKLCRKVVARAGKQ